MAARGSNRCLGKMPIFQYAAHWPAEGPLAHQSRTRTMDDIKMTAAKLHEDAAHGFEVAAKMHHEAAKHCGSGNFEKAESLALSAAEAEGVANRHATEAADQYRHHGEEIASRKAEAAAEEAARAVKHEAKAASEK
jgi:hypothetical protein